MRKSIEKAFEELENDFFHGKKSLELSTGFYMHEKTIHADAYGEIWFKAQEDFKGEHAGVLFFKNSPFEDGTIFHEEKGDIQVIIDHFASKAQSFLDTNLNEIDAMKKLGFHSIGYGMHVFDDVLIRRRSAGGFMLKHDDSHFVFNGNDIKDAICSYGRHSTICFMSLPDEARNLVLSHDGKGEVIEAESKFW